MPDALEVYLGTKEFRAFQRALHERPPKSVRMRVDRSSESLPFEHEPVPWYPLGFKLIDPKVRAGATLEYAVADFYIQDSASMLPLALLDIQPDDRVCDLCAAPGGKASAIAELLGTNGVLVANEVIAGRIDVLRYSLARTGRANYLVTNLDPDQLAQEFPANFDKVLVDVPCSGQSLLGRDRQSESAFAENHVLHCAARARRILQSAVQLLRPGGTLVLSTCTFSPEENEDQVTWLHSEYPGL